MRESHRESPRERERERERESATDFLPPLKATLHKKYAKIFSTRATLPSSSITRGTLHAGGNVPLSKTSRLRIANWRLVSFLFLSSSPSSSSSPRRKTTTRRARLTARRKRSRPSSSLATALSVHASIPSLARAEFLDDDVASEVTDLKVHQLDGGFFLQVGALERRFLNGLERLDLGEASYETRSFQSQICEGSYDTSDNANADVHGSDVSNVLFDYVLLRGANFEDAVAVGANFIRSDMGEMKIKNADFTEAVIDRYRFSLCETAEG